MAEPSNLSFVKFGMSRNLLNGTLSPVRTSLSQAQQLLMNNKLSILKDDLGLRLVLFTKKNIETLLAGTAQYVRKLFVEMAKTPKTGISMMKIVLNRGNVLSFGLSEGLDIDGVALRLSDPRGLSLSVMQRDHTIFIPDLQTKELQVLTFTDERHCLNASDIEKYDLNVADLVRAKKLRSLVAVPIIYSDNQSVARRELGAIIMASDRPGQEFIDAPGDLVVARELANFVSRALNNLI